MSILDLLENPDYSLEGLMALVRSELSGGIWRIEGMDQFNGEQLAMVIFRALQFYSERFPKQDFAMVPAGVQHYSIPDPGYGVVWCWFVNSIPFGVYGQAGVGLTQNLTGIGYNMAGNNVADIIGFLSWLKQYHRVASIQPDWHWDPGAKRLHVYNPANYEVCAILHRPVKFSELPLEHKPLFHRYVSALAKVQLAENRSKFSGSVQGPGGTTINLGGNELMTRALEERTKVEDEIVARAPRALVFHD